MRCLVLVHGSLTCHLVRSKHEGKNIRCPHTAKLRQRGDPEEILQVLKMFVRHGQDNDSPGMTGMTDASAMRRPRTPYTLSSGSTTALLPAVAPILQVPILALPAWHTFIMEVAFGRSSTPDLSLGQAPCRGMGQRRASCMLLCAPHVILPSDAHALPLLSAAWLIEDRIVALTGVHGVPDEAVNGRVGLLVCARVQLALGHARQRGLLRDLPRQPDAAPAWQSLAAS